MAEDKPEEPSFVIQDSGNHEVLESGMVRDSKTGKGRHDLISPIALKRLAQHYETGALKYDERNWEKGAPMSKHFDSAVRHLNDFLEGKRDEDHLIASAWNIFAAVHVEEMVRRGLLPKELCDMPNFMGDQE